MKSIKLSLDSIEKVKSFVNIVNKYDGDFDLASERYVVDAKSIMGIFSLDLGGTLRLDVHNEAVYEAIAAELASYTVK